MSAGASKLTAVEREALELASDPVLAGMLEEERVESSDLDFTLLFKLARYAGPHRWLAIGSILLSIVESFAMTLPAYIIGLALDRITSGHAREADALSIAVDRLGAWVLDVTGTTGNVAFVVFLGGLVAATWVVRWGFAVAMTFLVQMLGQRVVHDLRIDIYRHITSMGLDYFHQNPVGRLVNRTTFDVASISELFADAFAQGMRDVMFVLVLTGVMFALDPTLALVLISAFPLLVVVAWLYRRLARPSLRTMQAVQSRMNAWLAENIAGMRENQLYRREQRRRAEFHQLTQAHQASVTHVIQAWGFLRPAMMMVTAVGTAIVLLVGHDRVVEGAITVGVLLTFLQYTANLWVPIRNLTEKVNIIQTALTAAERIFDVLETRSTIVDSPDVARDAPVERGAIAFDDVRFKYPSSSGEVLRGISFDATPGQMIALVGDTGAGKTTIVNLISRFYDTTSGAVRVDGIDVRDYRLASLRRGIAIVPQDVVVFAGTLRDNITLGVERDDDDIAACLKAVGAESLMLRFERGLDHVLEEAGRTLSAGERQLLSFARALLVNPPILILDEATASIDTRTEVLIQRALAELTAGRTTIVIAHRLSTIRHADLILVLRDGEVIERGTHDRLLDVGGEYARLHAKHTA